MEILILVLVTLAIIALVLAVVAAKLVRKPVNSGTAPAAPVMTSPSGTPVTAEPSKTAGAKPAESKVKTSRPTPVPKRTDGEMESFDISVNASKVLWICPACGAENSYGSCCQVCAENRV